MIKEALEFLKENLKQPTTHQEILGRHFQRDDNNDWQEVKPIVEKETAFYGPSGYALRLGTIKALAAFVNQHSDRTCQIIVSKSDATAVFDIDKKLRSDIYEIGCHYVIVPFRQAKEKQDLTYVQFMDFMDQHTTNIQDYDNLMLAIRSFRYVDTNTLKVSERGPVITIESQASKDLEGGTTTIPKEIVINMPTGTREYYVKNTFLLRITISNGMAFTLTKKQHDGSWDALVELVLEDLRKLCPKDTFIVEGADKSA